MFKMGPMTLLRILEAAANRKIRENERKQLYASSDKFSPVVDFFIQDLSYDKDSKVLSFKIIRKTTTPKITRYVTKNYVRTPIYGDVSVRTAIDKKFHRTINPEKFVSEDILNLNLKKDFILKIIEEIGVMPKWREKEIKLENLNREIKNNNLMVRDYNKEKINYNFKKTNLPEIAGNFWLRLFFGFFTFFLSFIGYVSKKQAKANMKFNSKNKNWNKEHKKEIDNINSILFDEIQQNNMLINKKNKILSEEYEKVKNQKIELVSVDDEDWINLREASSFGFKKLENKKGIYIIRNKSENKYYVGQSKNIGKRLREQFRNGTVYNIAFAKDWYNGNDFYYKYYFCETKDQLDRLQKQYIEEYDSFENGYNKTSGNR